jgi:hypothetical protein
MFLIKWTDTSMRFFSCPFFIYGLFWKLKFASTTELGNSVELNSETDVLAPQS